MNEALLEDLVHEIGALRVLVSELTGEIKAAREALIVAPEVVELAEPMSAALDPMEQHRRFADRTRT